MFTLTLTLTLRRCRKGGFQWLLTAQVENRRRHDMTWHDAPGDACESVVRRACRRARLIHIQTRQKGRARDVERTRTCIAPFLMLESLERCKVGTRLGSIESPTPRSIVIAKCGLAIQTFHLVNSQDIRSSLCERISREYHRSERYLALRVPLARHFVSLVSAVRIYP